MAFIKQENRFDVDTLDLPVVGIAADVGRHDSGMHMHRKGQLLYAPLGCMNITLDNTQCILPPTKAAWIPAGVQHCVQMRNVVAYRSVYFDAGSFTELPQKMKIVSVNALLQALIERVALWEWDKPIDEQLAVTALFIEELESAPEESLLLPLPTDPRLKPWLSALRAGDELALPLKVMARSIGASEKTISRIFSRQTGMPYQAWRQQWRLHSAIEKLAVGGSVSQVAFSLGFSSDSAFISFFKQHQGNTPSQYMKAKPFQ
ncbi:helix-turn-helix transcriptional regulator [uncultured Shewanella sp.]|uniref:AraC family transcriptional regulator n=1 Tax=Shewanella atlantica TaxID=271099 RepID=UPI0026174CF8|nr:helix-turn-helix transcriptional regulator [uncultured Shewanella sp.]